MPLIGAGAFVLLAACLFILAVFITSASIYASRSRNRIALQIAAYKGDVDLLRSALTEGSDVNQKVAGYGDYWFEDITMLTIAAMGGHEQTINFLLNAGAEVNPAAQTGTPLMAAAAHNRVKAMDMLVKAGADMNASSRWFGTALWWAARHRACDSVQWLLRAGADVNAPQQRQSPLRAAADFGDPEMMRWMLEAGAHVNPEGIVGLSPLHGAANSGRVEAVELLLENGAQMRPLEGSGLHVIHYAIWSHNAANMVRRLIAAGADVNARDNDGATPLMLAAEANDLATVSVLLEAGADPSLTNSDSNRADEMGGPEVTAAIRQFVGARQSPNTGK